METLAHISSDSSRGTFFEARMRRNGLNQGIGEVFVAGLLEVTRDKNLPDDAESGHFGHSEPEKVPNSSLGKKK